LLTPIFIDLGQIPDEVLLSHKQKGAAEIAFKYIHKKNLLPYTDLFANSIKNLDSNLTKIVLQYVLQASKLDECGEDALKFIEKLSQKTPEKEKIMTSLLDQLTKQKLLEAAKVLLERGVKPEDIKAALGIDVKELAV
jgi:GTPase Era involved in 16S rRNA processing